jgi:hypothetical protein
MVEEWRVRDLEERLGRLSNEFEATLHLLSSFMFFFLELAPDDTARRARFVMICEELRQGVSTRNKRAPFGQLSHGMKRSLWVGTNEPSCDDCSHAASRGTTNS